MMQKNDSKEMFWCQRCLTPGTRPRITFNDEGVCNACLWHDKKQKEIDWNKKWERLSEICRKFRRDGDCPDVIVPCSGGKDGSYVAWKLKHDFGMHPVCITFMPQTQTWLGRQNLENFRAAGFDHVTLAPNVEHYRKIAKTFFLEQGRPKWPFVMGISTAIFQYAINFKIPFIMYGEEGEGEYGGSSEAKERIDRQYLINYYYEGNDPSKYGFWWSLPPQDQIDKLFPTHWSKFEDWDPEEHAKAASKNCGLQMMVGGSIGTFTNYSQLDDIFQDLHAYMVYIKYGFGRCTSDVSIEIRRGRMTRSEGVKLVNKLDGLFPLEYLPVYLDYFEMSLNDFWNVIDRFANKEILRKGNSEERPWVLKEQPKQCA